MAEYKLKKNTEPGLEKVKKIKLGTFWEILRDVLAVVITLIMLFPIIKF